VPQVGIGFLTMSGQCSEKFFKFVVVVIRGQEQYPMRLELNHNAEQNIDQEMAYLR